MKMICQNEIIARNKESRFIVLGRLNRYDNKE